MQRVVICQADAANAAPVIPAKILPDPFVFLAQPVFKGDYRAGKLMPLEGLCCAMWLQVNTAVRSQANQAGLHSRTCRPWTKITGHFRSNGARRAFVVYDKSFLEKLQHVSEFSIDTQFWGSMENLLAQWTVTDTVGSPVGSDAALAIVVSAGG